MPKTITTNLVDVERKDLRELTFVSVLQGEGDPPVDTVVWHVRAKYQVRDDQDEIHHVDTQAGEVWASLKTKMLPIVDDEVLPKINQREGM